ncbi:transmembrane 7 superfamily member 3 [Sorex araneus]|uniref:transmembrane 7 superfamily member 3 n=1 Tax=Sorex araneus TaxID=42254 RepID=UPI00243401F1|nr:transmembrane 7 superfamily member 3 [Sorex araneus]
MALPGAAALALLAALAALAAEPGLDAAAEREGLLELSVGRFTFFQLSKPFPKEGVLRNISSDVTFLIFQVHSQHLNTTVSFSKAALPGSSSTGTAQGLVSPLWPEQRVCTWHLSTAAAAPVQSMAVPLTYSERDPVPGGCNLESDLEIDPNIYLEYSFFETTIRFAPANLGSARGVAPPPCDVGTGQDSRWRLQYRVYQYFLPEHDLTPAALLSHLQAMAQAPQATARAVQVATLTADDKTSVSFSSLRGQGVIYNVVVWDPLLNTSAAYVPAHTYACSFDTPGDSCTSLGRASTKVFFTLFALLGSFVCFFGHRFWKTELFMVGFIIAGCCCYVLATRLTSVDYDARLILTAVAGGVGGTVLVAVWWRLGVLSLCMLCVGLLLGGLAAAVAFFTPLGNLKIFRDDSVFWVTFCCIAVLTPAFFVGCLRILNIVACAVLGSHSVVLAVDSYLYTSLSAITLNVLKRALRPDFRQAFTTAPLQTNDLVLLAVWGMLAVSGLTLQTRRERGRPPFPPHPYQQWKRERERRVTNILDPSHHLPPLRERLRGWLADLPGRLRQARPAGERTPLLL